MDEDLAAVAKRVWFKYGHDLIGDDVYAESDWAEWRDLGDALEKYYPDLRPNKNAPCKFGDERHDVLRCATHGGAISADEYDEAEREERECICTMSPKHWDNQSP